MVASKLKKLQMRCFTHAAGSLRLFCLPLHIHHRLSFSYFTLQNAFSSMQISLFRFISLFYFAAAKMQSFSSLHRFLY